MIIIYHLKRSDLITNYYKICFLENGGNYEQL